MANALLMSLSQRGSRRRRWVAVISVVVPVPVPVPTLVPSSVLICISKIYVFKVKCLWRLP